MCQQLKSYLLYFFLLLLFWTVEHDHCVLRLSIPRHSKKKKPNGSDKKKTRKNYFKKNLLGIVFEKFDTFLYFSLAFFFFF